MELFCTAMSDERGEAGMVWLQLPTFLRRLPLFALLCLAESWPPRGAYHRLSPVQWCAVQTIQALYMLLPVPRSTVQ